GPDRKRRPENPLLADRKNRYWARRKSPIGRLGTSAAVMARDLAQAVQPGQGRPAPILMARNEIAVLPQRAGPEAEVPVVAIGRRRIERCAAGRTEGLPATVAAVGDLDVDRGLAGEQAKASGYSRSHHAESRAAQRLAVGTVAQQHRLGVDLGFVS